MENFRKKSNIEHPDGCRYPNLIWIENLSGLNGFRIRSLPATLNAIQEVRRCKQIEEKDDAENMLQDLYNLQKEDPG
ncbi:hypothetical protein RIR_jg28594.t1 [Rhizophagus irregularis DAOM 181602=DAOM 197198]|nr:hypothetical protein RIR_jg28594.t1 [Rhizophagus irregularis DAOM 181602=DAOM 197198]